ncbi:MAG TPA: lasso RiPP family leader peptide-containing protein [Candidatus Acidoferrum sp.]|nr:lasso RiPP family leader peptide-containing protein [Candidatus Acidoferrum sp.]
MKRGAEVPVKKPYQAPKLIVYGDLTELTMASGTKKGTIDNTTKPTTRT